MRKTLVLATGLIFLWVSCKKDAAYTYRLSDESFVNVLIDLEYAKTAVLNAKHPKPDSLMDVYLASIADRYDVDVYELKEELNQRLKRSDQLKEWYVQAKDSIAATKQQLELERKE